MRLTTEPGRTERPAGHPLRRIAGAAAMLVLCVLTAAALWAGRSYSNITLEECLFYLSMPLQGTSLQFQQDIVRSVLVPGGAAFLVLLAATLLPRRRDLVLRTRGGRRLRLLPLRMRGRTALLLMLAWACLIVPYANSLLGIRRFLWHQLTQSPLIGERYADPAKTRITFPEKKRNLITIYVESAETTNQDAENGGRLDRNYTPEMTEMALENVSFSQSDLLEGAAVAPACGWTVAGMVAQMGGLPLKLFGYGEATVDNMGEDFVSFLPGATMLGDILKAEGYRTAFLCGSDIRFGGRGQLLSQHGAYEIYDYPRAKELGWIPGNYSFGWGFEDAKLYEFAKTLLTEMAAEGTPFHLAMLTVDTHDPGWICPLCPDTHENFYGRTLRCSSRQVSDFIAWCREQPFFEDTAIVVTGDHASMTKSLYEDVPEYDKHNGSQTRLVYNCFINASAEPAREKNRRFTTLDFFPSTLAAIGCGIEGERLGLGTNLFSDVPTLSEELGYGDFFEELSKKSAFYDAKLLR